MNLLGDEDLAHIARYALARPGDDGATTALRDALPDLSGDHLAGAIRSLGELGDAMALPSLDALISAPNPMISGTAIEAVGQVGGPEAVELLQRRFEHAAEAQRPALLDALFACAEQFLVTGEPAAALAIYQPMYTPDAPPLLRFAALDGIVRAQQSQAIPLLLDLLDSPDSDTQSAAAQYVRDLEGAGVTQAFAERLPGLAPMARIALIEALEARGDAAARPAVIAALGDESPDVRAAAVGAFESLGQPDDVLTLARYATTQRGKARETAIQALSHLPGEGIEEEMVNGLDCDNDKVRVTLLEAIAKRGLTDATAAVLGLLEARKEAVRIAAVGTLEEVGNEALLPHLLAHLRTPRGERERNAVTGALTALSRQANVPSACTALLAGASVTATDAAIRAPVLRALGQLGGEQALWAVALALDTDSPETSDAAVRALCDWPDALVLPELFRCTAAESDVHRVLALRAICRLLGEQQDRNSSELLALYGQAMAAATRPEEKRLVLGGLASLTSVDALALARPHLAQPELEEEAALAVAKIARNVVGVDAPLALSAAQEAAAVSDSELVKQEAQRTIDLARSMADYVMNWVVSAPWTAPGTTREGLLNTPFLPEEEAADNIEWEPMPVGLDPGKPWLLNLKKAIGGGDRAAFLLTYVHSAKTQPARLELGSDDAVKVWLNGRHVHANLVWRGVNPGEDTIPITLQPGWNQLLLKVVQGNGDWGACAKLLTRDGESLGGFRTTTVLTAEDAQALAPPAPPVPMLRWNMERNDAGELMDTSGYGVTAPQKGTPTFVEGISGDAMQSDGVDDEIRVKAAHLPVEAGAPWTLNVFVYLDEQPEELTIIGGFGDVKSGRPIGCQRFLVKFKQGIHFWGSCVDVNAGVPFELGRWQMVTVTYDGKTVAIYKDGKHLVSSEQPLAEAAPFAVVTPLDHWKKNNRLKGRIDDFSIWSGALTAEQVEELAAESLPR